MLNIKRHISLLAIYSAIAILHGVVLASCTNDDAIGDTNDKVSDSETASYYMAVKIYDATDGAPLDATSEVPSFDSKFPDVGGEDGNIFNKGLDEEKAIYDNYENGMHNFIMLFDGEGKKVGDLLHLKPFIPDDEDKKNLKQEGEDYSSYFLFVAKNDVLRKNISKVLVVLNASADVREELNKATATTYDGITSIKMLQNNTESIATADADSKKEYADATKFLYLDVSDGTKETRYFTMSSSMVVNNNSVVAATSGTLGDHLKPTKAEALANPFKMYVERTQSKYTVLFERQSDSEKYYFDTPNASATGQYTPVASLVYESEDFTPKDEYKSLRYVESYTRSKSVNSRSEVDVNEGSWKVKITGWGVNGLEKNEYLFKKIEPSAIYFTNWQTTLPYRNYWAESYHYSDGTYPDQYRKVFNGSLTDLENLESLEQLQDPTLNYFSFSALNQQKPHQYSPENTFSTEVFGKDADLTEAFESKAFLRVGTHLIVTAELLIEGIDYEAGVNTTGATTAGDKLYMNGIYWKEAAYKEYVAEYLAYWMLTDENQMPDKFGPNDGNFYVKSGDSYRLAEGSDFLLKAAHIKGGDGWVYLSPSPNVILYTKTTDNEGKVIYKDISDTQYETLAYEHQELMAGHFNDGCMYYAVPVEHNNAGSTKTKITTGDYGAVRNHWYAFTVNQIFSVGTPVDDPEQPIVPNLEPKNPGLGVEVKILNWHQVSTGVDISGQRPEKK